MAANRLTQAVRHQLGLGRLLPLGGAEDGAWLTEETAVAALRSAVAGRFPGVRLSGVRLDLSDPPTAAEPVVPRPPSALGTGPLTLDAELAVAADEPLPALTASLRHALLAAAERELGLELRTVNLRVGELLDAPEPPDEKSDQPSPRESPDAPESSESPEAPEAPNSDEPDEPDNPATRIAAAVLAVPGVSRLAPVLGSPLTAGGPTGRAVRVTDNDTESDSERPSEAESEGDGRGGGRHVLLQLAVARGNRALDVARAARSAAATAARGGASGPVSVAVLITRIDRA